MISNWSRWFQPSKNICVLYGPLKLVSKLFFVSKFIILTYIDKLFYILHILIDSNDFLVAIEVSVVKKNFLRSKLSPFLTCVQITFVSKFIILTFIYKLFFYFAYYDRKQWFLVGTGGFSRPNFFSVLIWINLQIIFVSKFVLLTYAC